MNKQKFIALPFAVLVAMVVFTLAMAAVPAVAQNAVPPTARQAAASPAFASRLHPPAGGAHLQHYVPSRRPPRSPQDQTLYDNGPYNSTTDAWDINFGFSVSDSFTVPSGSSIEGLHFVYWNASTSDLLTTVDMSLGSTSFGGTVQTLTGITNTFLGTNQYGYALFQADYTVSNIPWSGTGYVTLSNACTSSGCSISNPIYWDENGGPSTAYENTVGSIPSETFDLTGSVGPACQDDETVVYAFTGGEDGAYPTTITNDQAGGVYGTTASGAIFHLSEQGAGWLLTNLYRFAGGSDGSSSAELTVGPDGRLYGVAADGGIFNCPGGYCGVVFSVQPQPSACLTTSCSWQKTVLYQFTGVNDAWNPVGKLIFDRAGNLYGISDGGAGAVYQLAPSSGGWTEKILHTFNGSDGNLPNALVIDDAGNLYGTTGYGGAYGWGVVYQLTPSGTGWMEKVLYSFGQNQDEYPTSLIQGWGGALYGTAWGPPPHWGLVFGLSPQNDWVYRVECRFESDGPPIGLIPGGGLGITHDQIFQVGIPYCQAEWDFRYWNVDFATVALNDISGVTKTGGRYCKGAIWQWH